MASCPGRGTGDVNGRPIRHHRHRGGPGRLRRGHSRGATRVQDGGRRARAPRRDLSQLGLHTDEGAAAVGRDLSLHAAREGLRPLGSRRRLRRGGDRAALPHRIRPTQRRGRRPAQEEQGRRDLGRGDDLETRRGDRHGAQEGADAAAASRVPGRPGARRLAASTSSSPRGHDLAVLPGSSPTASSSGPISRPWSRPRCRNP